MERARGAEHVIDLGVDAMHLSTPVCEVCGAPVEDVSQPFCGGDRCRGVLMPPITAMSYRPASVLPLLKSGD